MNKQMILSLLMACGIVLGAVTLMNRDLQQTKQKEPESIPTPPEINKTHDRKVIQSNQVTKDQENDATVKITKCSIGNKVIYSDKPCPTNAVISQIEIRETDGIVTPDRNTVERTMRRIEEEHRHDTQNSKAHILIMGKQGDKAICDKYQKSIDEYNAWARQPLPGQTQDWIRGEIVKIRTYQAAANC